MLKNMLLHHGVRFSENIYVVVYPLCFKKFDYVFRPKYCSSAEEILLNDIAPLGKETWNKYLEEAKGLLSNLENKMRKTTMSKEYNLDFGISLNELIGVNHLVVTLIYTDNIYF